MVGLTRSREIPGHYDKHSGEVRGLSNVTKETKGSHDPAAQNPHLKLFMYSKMCHSSFEHGPNLQSSSNRFKVLSRRVTI